MLLDLIWCFTVLSTQYKETYYNLYTYRIQRAQRTCVSNIFVTVLYLIRRLLLLINTKVGVFLFPLREVVSAN